LPELFKDGHRDDLKGNAAVIFKSVCYCRSGLTAQLNTTVVAELTQLPHHTAKILAINPNYTSVTLSDDSTAHVPASVCMNEYP
jgi:hypothetical protein